MRNNPGQTIAGLETLQKQVAMMQEFHDDLELFAKKIDLSFLPPASRDRFIRQVEMVGRSFELSAKIYEHVTDDILQELLDTVAPRRRQTPRPKYLPTGELAGPPPLELPVFSDE